MTVNRIRLTKIVLTPSFLRLLLLALSWAGVSVVLILLLQRIPPRHYAAQPPEKAVHNYYPNILTYRDISLDWTPFYAPLRSRSPIQESVRPLRLLGTVSEFGGSESRRRAIIDDINHRRQLVLAEGQVQDGISVQRIRTDHVDLEVEGKRVTLRLRFASPGSEREIPSVGPGVEEGKGAFGSVRLAEDTWELSRVSLLEYYKELLQEPQRLYALFASLKPEYQLDGAIGGYRLRTEGEDVFFNAIGLSEGDVIRSVNSLEMTRRPRAEYLIREFVNGRIDDFVVEMEREGQPLTQIYSVR